MFGRKSALIKHYEGETDRLRQRVASLELANARLVDRLLTKNGIETVTPVELPASPVGLDAMAVFQDIDEEADNRNGEKYDGFVE